MQTLIIFNAETVKQTLRLDYSRKTPVLFMLAHTAQFAILLSVIMWLRGSPGYLTSGPMRRFSTRLSVSRGSRCCQTPQSRSASANKEISLNCPLPEPRPRRAYPCQFVGSQWARPYMQGTLRLIRTRPISVSKGIVPSGPLLKSENWEEYVLDFEKGCGLFWNCPNWIRIYLTGKQHLRLVTRTGKPVSTESYSNGL